MGGSREICVDVGEMEVALQKAKKQSRVSVRLQADRTSLDELYSRRMQE